MCNERSRVTAVMRIIIIVITGAAAVGVIIIVITAAGLRRDESKARLLLPSKIVDQGKRE